MLGDVEIYSLLESYPEFLEYLQGEKIPQWFLNEVHIFKVPQRQLEFLVQNYELLQQEEYHRLKFSFEDWAIAHLAAQYRLSVLSYDRDLLVEIKEYLDYTVISPESIPHIPQDSIILLDTNILFALIDPEQKKFQEKFEELFNDHRSIVFALPELIVAEFKKTKKKLADREKKEPEYSEFIDDESNFAPKERPRKKLYREHKGEKDWSVSKRYRKIL